MSQAITLEKPAVAPQLLDVTAADLEEKLAKDYQMDEMNNIVIACSPMKLSKRGVFEQTAILGAGMQRLRNIMDASPMKHALMSLQGTPLGFTTDRDRAKEGAREYDWPVVRDCMIDGALKGLRPIDNEITIIAGKMYPGKNGVKRLVREFAGLKNLVTSYGMPQIAASQLGAVVKCAATWVLNNAAQSMECDLPIKGDAYSTVDQYLGKAERKLHARIYNQLTGSDMIDENDEDYEPIDQPYRAVGGRLQPAGAAGAVSASISASRQAAPGATREEPAENTDAPAPVPTAAPQAPKSGRPGPQREAAPKPTVPTPPAAAEKSGEPSPEEKIKITAEETVGAMPDLAAVKQFLETVPDEVLKKAKDFRATNLDDKAPEKEWRNVAITAMVAMATNNIAPKPAADSPEAKAQAFVDAAKAKGGKQVEKELGKVNPGILEAAKTACKFEGSIKDRKADELAPLLYACKLFELKSP